MASGSVALSGVTMRDVAGFGRLARPLRTATELNNSLSANPARSASLSTRCEAPPSLASVAGPYSTPHLQSTFGPQTTRILDEPFSIVSDSVATNRAAAAEALALAKAAAVAASQAAALAEADDLALLDSLTAGSSSDSWDMASFLEAGGLVTGSETRLSGDLERLMYPSAAADLIQSYISDKQKLSSAFAAPSAQPAGEIWPTPTPSGAPAAAAIEVTRVLVTSGKKGRRTSRTRKTVKAAAEAAAANSQVQKYLPVGIPGSLRDLMDATPGAAGLLTAAEEITLAKSAQAMFKLQDKETQLREELGREPTRQEWAYTVGMDVCSLEKVLTEGMQSKKRMISSNMGLVISTARKYSTWGLSLEEILTRGCSGLIKAIEKFDHTKGFKFSTYAHWWIRQSIGRSVTEQSRTVRMPPHVYELLARVSKARDMLLRELGRAPADEEVAELVGMTATRLRKVLRSAKPMVSMDKPSSMDGEQTLGSFLASPEDDSHDLSIERKLLSKDLENALHTLMPREREVLKLRYGLTDGRPRTLEEVGAAFRVTRERIRQLEHRALRKLRQPNRSSVLKEYVEEA